MALQERVDSVRAFAEELPGLFDSPEEAPMACNGGTIVNGLNDLQRAAVSAYPVPAHDLLFLRTVGSSAGDAVFILDARGQFVLSGRVKGELTEVDLSTLPPGFYVVRIAGNRNTMITSFIKE